MVTLGLTSVEYAWKCFLAMRMVRLKRKANAGQSLGQSVCSRERSEMSLIISTDFPDVFVLLLMSPKGFDSF